jgi:hypothetical protein
MSQDLVWAAVRRPGEQGLVDRVFRDAPDKLARHLRAGERLIVIPEPINTAEWRFDESDNLVPFTPTPIERLETDLAAARRERDMRLGRTDWIELPSNRARKTGAFVTQMDAYRQNARDAVSRVKEGLAPLWAEAEPED